jgi:hypothetical protein
VADGCSACLRSNCTAAMNNCLANVDCRRSLDAYAKCLPSSCVDDGDHCAEGISDVDLGLCMKAKCSTPCGGGAAVSRCELYCACMKNDCPSQFAGPLRGTDASCLSACGGLHERDIDCRWKHCEFAGATNSTATHCPHATGENDVCNSVPKVDRHVCLTGTESGYPCMAASECCSGKCPAMFCN